MTKIVFQNGKILTLGGKWIIPDTGVGPEPGPQDEVQIGDQIWKSKNLAIDDGGEGIYTQTVNYGEGDVVEYYYTWEAAVRVAGSVSGWHLPTDAEWNTLANTVGSSTASMKLRSTFGWTNGNGTDDYGFTALPAGEHTNRYYYLYNRAYFWTATQRNTSNAYYCALLADMENMYAGNSSKTYAKSVRLLKDEA